jgi:hypothetical protein
MEPCHGAVQEMQKRDSDISSTNSSARKNPRKNEMADAIHKLADNRIQVNLDNDVFDVMQRKEEQLNERHKIEKEKLSSDSVIQKKI